MNVIKNSLLFVNIICSKTNNSLLRVSASSTLLNIVKYNNKSILNNDNTQSQALKTEKDSLSGLKNTFDMFDKVSAKHNEISDNDKVNKPIDNRSFAAMLRESSLIGIGDPNGRLISGQIIETVDDDLYIDFGGKFHCVCKRPKTKARF